MTMRELAFRGVWLAEGSRHEDERGSFERLVDLEELRSRVADPGVAYAARVRNRRSGTIRGLHFQVDPHGEAKTLWCEAGHLYDVLVDVRPGESTYGQWLAVELHAGKPQALHVPKGVAHGYQTMADNTTVVYLISAARKPSAARTIHWADPTLAIAWPRPATVVSAADQAGQAWPTS